MQSVESSAPPSWQTSSWTCVRPATSINPSYALTEFDDLSNRYPYMSKDIVEKYMQKAIDRVHEEDLIADNKIEADHEAHTSESIDHQSILSKAETIVLTRFTKVARRRIPAVHKPVKRRRLSADIDNIDLHADDVPFPTPKRTRTLESFKGATTDEKSPLTPSTTSVPLSKRPCTDSDKENESPLSPFGNLDDIMPYNIGMPLDLVNQVDRQLFPSIPYQRCAVTPILASQRTISTDSNATKVMKSAVTPASLERRSCPEEARSDTGKNRSSQSEFSPAMPITPLNRQRPKERDGEIPHSPDEAFSDDSSLFEQLAIQEVMAAQNDSNQVEGQSAEVLTPPSSIDLSRDLKRATSSQKYGSDGGYSGRKPYTPSSSVQTMPLSPFIRQAPMSQCTPSLLIGRLMSESRLITCFRIAEVLRLRSQAMSQPLSIDTDLAAPILLHLELFASVRSTARQGMACIVEFQDMFFPERPPFLAGLHTSWREVERETAILRSNVPKEMSLPSLLSRAVILVSINRRTTSAKAMEVKVLSLRATDEEEITRVRGIVDSKYQNKA